MVAHEPSILMGIDPGFDRVGWAICELVRGSLTPLAYGCITTDRSSTRLERYQQLALQLNEIVDTYHPQAAAVESLFFATNQKTAIAVAQARGVILSQLFLHQVTVHEYTPLQIKQAAAGHGGADKAAVEKMVRLQLRLPAAKILDDTIDALAMVITLQARLRTDAHRMV